MGSSAHAGAILRNLDTLQSVDLSRGRTIIGRSASANVILYEATCSRVHAAIEQHDEAFVLRPLSATQPTLLNDTHITESVPLHDGEVIQIGRTRLQFVCRLAKPTSRDPFRNKGLSHPDATRMAGPLSDDSVPAVQANFPVYGRLLIGRDLAEADIHLPHVHVSSLHAEVLVQGDQTHVRDLQSANGTFVNGRRILASTVVEDDDRIDIGPYSLIYREGVLSAETRSNNVQLECRGVSQVVRDRFTGGAKTLLDNISLVVRPREFVCLIGKAGCGKSTLLAAMSARTPASTGAVYVNDVDVYANFESLKHDMALVPQRDVLHRHLSVQQALKFTARLRLPPDTTASEVDRLVDEILETVTLTPHRRTLIKNLSGGQTRRASLASEIIANPSLMFLDEVTSGLDEQTDAEVMQLFRRIADRGKTVVCITHSLVHVDPYCDKLVVLADGGRLAFVGTPDETKQYFGVSRLGDIYEALSRKSPDEWKQAFLDSEFYTQNVDRHFSSQLRQHGSSFHKKPFSLPEYARRASRQAVLLLQREILKKSSDWRSLAVIGGQCLLVALMIVALFGNVSIEPMSGPSVGSATTPSSFLAQWGTTEGPSTAKILFLMVVSSFWFGCNNTARDLVAEKPIYTRERDVNLCIAPYVLAKLAFWSTLGIIQTLVMYAIVRQGCQIDGPSVSYLAFLTTSVVTGTAIGLCISAVARTQDMAISMVPVFVIPQIILAGCIAPVDGWTRFLSQLTVHCYWSYNGVLRCVEFHEHLPNPMQPLEPFFVTVVILVAQLAFALSLVGMLLDYQKGRDNLYELALARLATRRTLLAGQVRQIWSDVRRRREPQDSPSTTTSADVVG